MTNIKQKITLSIFDYDRELSLNIEEIGVEYKNGISIHDISYSSLANGKIDAYLVMPAGKGPFSSVVFVHPAPGNRSTFINESEILARKGVASLLIDAPWAQGEVWARSLGKPESDRKIYIQIVKDLRRAIDVITSRPDVATNRIGYVGHSFGALFGGVLSGVERRIKAFVLMAGTGSFTDFAVLNMPALKGQALEEYKQAMALIDPICYIGNAAPSSLFFQFGFKDDFFAREKFEEYVEAGSEQKLIKWYNADHYLNDEARSDRIEWLYSQLGLEQP